MSVRPPAAGETEGAVSSGDAVPRGPALPPPAGKRSSVLGGLVFGVGHPRWLSDAQRRWLHEAVAECSPEAVEELERLARDIAESRSRSDLRTAAEIVAGSGVGPAGRRLLRLAYKRVERSLAVIREAMGEGPWSR